VFFYKALLISGMDDFLLKCVLFECIRGSLERTDACLDIFTERHAIMMLTYCFLNKGICSFLSNPYARVLSASGVITRFNKKLSMERLTEKTPRPLNYIEST
jgi:hypothetical protein